MALSADCPNPTPNFKLHYTNYITMKPNTVSYRDELFHSTAGRQTKLSRNVYSLNYNCIKALQSEARKWIPVYSASQNGTIRRIKNPYAPCDTGYS
jgi:hypothetical protein